jgi:replication factor A1
MDIELTQGVCEKLSRIAPGTDDPVLKTEPVIQVLSIKRVTSASGDRYRIILSDGLHYIQSMLATQLNGMVNENEINRLAIVRLKSFTVNKVQEKR